MIALEKRMKNKKQCKENVEQALFIWKRNAQYEIKLLQESKYQ